MANKKTGYVGDNIYTDGPCGVSPLTADKERKEFDSHFNESTFNKDLKPSKQKARDYKCPECDGEFNNWRKKYKNSRGDWVDKQYILSSTTNTDKRSFCPFCDMKRGEYNNE